MRKNAKKYIILECHKCGNKFNKELKEYTRQIKNNRNHFYCSKDCCSAGSQEIQYDKHKTNFLNHYFQEIKKSARSRNREINLTISDLKIQWNKQNGICPYTGIKMEIRKSQRIDDFVNPLKAVSIDRIDSNKGYTKGNIEFVCRFVNWGKNGNTKEEVIDFIKSINFNGSLPE